MLTIVGGPAQGKAEGLCISRAPLYLRLVVDAEGKWDALDMMGDSLRPGEQVYAYRRTKNEGTVHVNRRGKNGRCTGGTFVRAEYTYMDPQPDMAILESTRAWQEWANHTHLKSNGSAHAGGDPANA